MTIRQALAPWPHYPRRQLASRYLATLRASASRSISVIGATGVGKTEFLRFDLMPLAIANGWRCVYVDLRKCLDRPFESLIAQLDPEPAVRAKVLASRPHSCVARLLAPSLLERLEWQPAASTEAHPADPAPREIERRLHHALQRLLNDDARRLLLIVDNIECVRTAVHQPVGDALKQVLARYDLRVSTIFASSSRIAFDASMQNRSIAHASLGDERLTLPRIDEGFEHAIGKWAASRAGGIEPDLNEMRSAMRALARSPRLFRSAVALILAGEATHIGDAAAQVRANAVNGIGLLAPIGKLTALQAVLLREVWCSGEALYAMSHRARYASATGVTEVSKVDVQGGLKRLERLGLVFRDDDGLYRLASTNLDALFELDQIEQNSHPTRLSERPTRTTPSDTPSSTPSSSVA